MTTTSAAAFALGMTIIVGCGSSSGDNTSVSNDGQEINEGQPADPPAEALPTKQEEQIMEVDDLDGLVEVR